MEIKCLELRVLHIQNTMHLTKFVPLYCGDIGRNSARAKMSGIEKADPGIIKIKKSNA